MWVGAQGLAEDTNKTQSKEEFATLTPSRHLPHQSDRHSPFICGEEAGCFSSFFFLFIYLFIYFSV
jgi:hypothetical protein